MKQLVTLIAFILSLSVEAQAPLLRDLWYHSNSGQALQYDLNPYLSEKVSGAPGFDTGLSEELDLPKDNLSDVIVAVMDTGADISHPLLIKTLALNEKECSGGKPKLVASTDEDQNGYNGDCIGLDFTKESTDRSFHRVSDLQGHGTHVSGVIASFATYSPHPLFQKIRILPLKVVGAGPVGLQTRIVRALDYAHKRGAKVVNFSMGWPQVGESTLLKEAIQLAQQRGMIIVAAAGNNSHDSALYPCNYRGVICVGANQNDGKMSRFSNFGAHVDFSAPGSQILSSVPFTVSQAFSNLKGYDKKSGTSQAAPIITAFVASLLVANPALTRDEIYHRLALASPRTSSGITSLNGFPALGKLFSPSKKSLIQLEMKERVTQVMSGMDVDFPIHLVNLGKDRTKARLEYRILTRGYDITKAQEEIEFNRNEDRKTLSLRVSPSGLMVDSFLRVEVKITAGEETKVYVLNSQIMREGALKRLSGALDFARDGKIYSLNSSQSSSGNAYFMAIKDSRLTLFTKRGSSLIRLGTMTLPAGESLILGSSQVTDLDLDGEDDLFLITKRDEESLSVSYRKLNLLPLLPKHPFFQYKVEAAVFSASTKLSFMTQVFMGQSIRVPVFIESGITTAADFQHDYWDFKRNISERHLYWLEPRLIDGSAQFITRTLTNERFRKGIIKTSGLTEASKVEFITIAPGSSQSLKVLGVLKDIDGVNIASMTFQVKELGGTPLLNLIYSRTRTVDNVGLVFPVESLGSVGENILYVSAPKANEISLYKISGDAEPSMIHMTDVKAGVSDEFLDVTSASVSVEGLTVYLQTKNSIVMISENGKPRTRPIIRHSFLDGTLASEFYQSIRVEIDATKPALYVDQSFVNGNGTYSLVEYEGELVSPLAWSLQIPSGCSTMDPVLNREAGVHEVLVQCRNREGDYFLMNFPLRAH